MSQTVTVIDRQHQVYWERQAPFELTRDHALTVDAWVMQVLQRHGPLSTPQLVAVAGLKLNTLRACLKKLDAQGHVRKRGVMPSTSSPGRRGDIWDTPEP